MKSLKRVQLTFRGEVFPELLLREAVLYANGNEFLVSFYLFYHFLFLAEGEYRRGH